MVKIDLVTMTTLMATSSERISIDRIDDDWLTIECCCWFVY